MGLSLRSQLSVVSCQLSVKTSRAPAGGALF
jgi:hypothetical protein